MTLPATTYGLVGGALRRASVSRYTAPPPPGLTQVESGLIYFTDFTDLDGWDTSAGGWSRVDAPSLVTFGRFPLAVLGPGVAAGPEDMGVREPQLFIEDDDNWWLLYDAGDGTNPWQIFIASSNDQGLTWTRHGTLDAPIAPWAAVAMGWVEKRGDTYYLHRVTAGSLYPPGPNYGLLSSPYRWDTYQSDSILGTWEYVNTQATVPGGWAASSYMPSSVVEEDGTYYAFVQGKGTTGSYRVGLAVAPSPTGPWTAVSTPLYSTTFFGSRSPENTKVFWNEGLERWVMLLNLIASSGQFTDRNAALLSTSLTDWTSAIPDLTQRNALVDGANGTAVGIAAPLMRPDGDPITEDGWTPIVFDSAPLQVSPGWHLQRSILATVLEPSRGQAIYSDAAATAKKMTRNLAHTDIEVELAIRMTTGSSTNIGLWVRQPSGTSDGYRITVRSNQSLLCTKYVGGVATTLANPALQIAEPTSTTRLRVKVEGNSIKAWQDGQLQVNVTDSSHPTGDQISLAGFAATGSVRRLSVRTGDAGVQVSGLTPGDTAVIRSYGGLPVEKVLVDGAGLATFTVDHGPHRSFQVDDTEYEIPSGIWPGDTYAL